MLLFSLFDKWIPTNWSNNSQANWCRSTLATNHLGTEEEKQAIQRICNIGLRRELWLCTPIWDVKKRRSRNKLLTESGAERRRLAALASYLVVTTLMKYSTFPRIIFLHETLYLLKLITRPTGVHKRINLITGRKP